MSDSDLGPIVGSTARQPSVLAPLRLEPSLERRAVTFAYVALAAWSLLVIAYCGLLFWIR